MLLAPALVALCVAVPNPDTPAPPDRYGPWQLKNGLYLPYPVDSLFRGSFSCGRKRRHLALDVGGVGPDYGLGTPIRSIGEAEVVGIGTPELDPARYGERDTGEGETLRGRRLLPRSREIPGYGRVFFFTKDHGSSRTGVIVTTRLTRGRHKGYTVRYLHLAAVRPDLVPGARLAAGEELGLMGGTAVLESAPHLHLDIRDGRGKAVDVGATLGIGSTRLPCKKAAAQRARQRYIAKARRLMAQLEKKGRRGAAQ